MKARQLLGSATFDPATLTIVYKAFDAAWEHIAPGVGPSLTAIEAARLKLAETVITTARELEEFDAAGLASVVLDRMHAQPTEIVADKPTDQRAEQP